MNATTHQIPGFPFSVTDEDIANLLCSAFEGGATYWVRRATSSNTRSVYASDGLKDGGEIRLRYDAVDQDEGNGKGRFTLTLDAMLNGLALMLSFKDGTRFYMAHITGDLQDAETADCALQFAVLGDIVYG